MASTAVESIEADLEKLGSEAQGSGLAAAARSLAEALDGENSATSKSMCAKALIDVMRELRSLAPLREEDDEVERARKRRAVRLARQSATGTAPSS